MTGRSSRGEASIFRGSDGRRHGWITVGVRTTDLIDTARAFEPTAQDLEAMECLRGHQRYVSKSPPPRGCPGAARGLQLYGKTDTQTHTLAAQ
jgi:hypothetical protein